VSQHAREHPEQYEEREEECVSRCRHRKNGHHCILDAPHPDETHFATSWPERDDAIRWDSTESDPR
jgi:hypothetical protein